MDHDSSAEPAGRGGARRGGRHAAPGAPRRPRWPLGVAAAVVAGAVVAVPLLGSGSAEEQDGLAAARPTGVAEQGTPAPAGSTSPAAGWGGTGDVRDLAPEDETPTPSSSPTASGRSPAPGPPSSPTAPRPSSPTPSPSTEPPDEEASPSPSRTGRPPRHCREWWCDDRDWDD